MSPRFNCPGCSANLDAEFVPGFGTPTARCPVCGHSATTVASSTIPGVEHTPGITEDDRELLPGEVLGWRAWDVVTLGKLVRLQSVTHKGGLDSVWPTDRWFRAECSRGAAEGDPFKCPASADGRIPGVTSGGGRNCGCGLYSAMTYKQLTEDLSYGHYQVTGETVIGQVAFAGKVVIGSQGYRAERGRVAHIYVPHGAWKLGKRISEQYHVPYDIARWIGR